MTAATAHRAGTRDRGLELDAEERRRAEYRAMARIRLTMARVLATADDDEGARSALAAAKFWRVASHDAGRLIVRGGYLL